MTHKYKNYAATGLRVFVGLLFIIPGANKLMNPAMITGMLGGLGFPAAGFFAWVLLLSEISFGAAVLLGWKLEYTVWPLVAVLGVAVLTVHIPALGSSPMATVTVLWHLMGLSALVSLFLSGPGEHAVPQ